MAPGVAAEGPAGALQLRHDGLHGLNLLLAVGLLFGSPAFTVGLGAVAQDALVARQAQAALGAEGGEVRVLLHEFVQNGHRVQIPADHFLALGVLAPGPELAVLPDDQFICEAVGQHVLIVIYIIVGEDQRLFTLGEVESIFHHAGLARLIGLLAPAVRNVHQDVALFVDALQNLQVLSGGDHPVVDAVGFAVPVKGQLRVGHHGVEEQVLHHTVVGNVGHAVPDAAFGLDGGIQDGVGLRLRFSGSVSLRCFSLGRGLRLGGAVGPRCGGGAAGGQGQQQQQCKQ